MKKAACVSAFALALAALTAPAGAVPVQGELGQNSTGSFDVSVTVDLVDEARVRVTGLTDIDVGLIDEFTVFPVLRNGSACFYHTSPTFSLTVTGPGGSTPLAITDGQGGSAPFSLTFFFDGGSRAVATSGGTITGVVGNTVSETCASGPPPASVQAMFAAVGLADGVHSTTVNLVMAVD